ncbi:MAG: DUF3127 domain-containing protein [Pseudoflavonifractor sp.]|nr:DUF3127 domain-containing protein [Alloprevotella sp.]MCM1116489.1 DUF3127 domain-containing protein [Pseudoflavonifractor sp.]
MEIQGKIIHDLGETSGTSRAGNAWKKHEYVLETHETYPKKVAFTLFGERADQYQCAINDEITLSFDINSREFNGRWYTDITAWKIEKGAAGTQSSAAAAAPAPAYGAPAAAPAAPAAPADPFGAPAGGNDDLPF